MHEEFLNDYAEVHAGVIGLFAGLCASRGYRDEFGSIVAAAFHDWMAPEGHLTDLRSESAYFAAGTIVGYVLGRFAP